MLTILQFIGALRQEKAGLVAQAQAIFDGAAAENRALTDDEETQVRALQDQAEALDPKIESRERQERLAAAAAASQGTRAGAQDQDPNNDGGVAVAIVSETRDANGYANKFTGSAGPMIVMRKFAAGDKALAEQVVGLHKALATGDHAQVRALSEGTDSDGGYLVPEEFAQDIIEKVGQETPLANKEFMRVIPMNRDVMNVPALATRPTVSRIAENAAGTGGTDPAFGNVQLTARKYGRVLPMSEELLEDTTYAIVEFLRDLYAEILAENRNNLIINGAGSVASEPLGVRATGTGIATRGGTMTAGKTIHDSVVDTYNTVIPKARAGGLWLTSPRGWAVLAKAKDDQGRPLIQLLGGEPFARLLGHPLFVTEAVPANLGVGTDETELIFGNFKRGFAFGDRRQVAVKQDASGKYFENFQVALRVSERWDGAVANAQYFVRGTGWK